MADEMNRLPVDDDSDDDEKIICWCGASGTADELFNDAVFDEPCGGSGTLECMCGGDFCVCHHHSTVECPGCEDCRTEDQWDDDGYDDED